MLAHILGWFGKSLILRDFWLSWILSVMFEVMEYSLQHQLPNFAECWWDHVRASGSRDLPANPIPPRGLPLVDP